MGDELDVSNYKLRQLRSAAAKDGRLDEAVLEELAALDDEHRLYVFRPETRCKVCMSEFEGVVNKMISNALTYTDILNTLKPINDILPTEKQITYTSIYNHAKRHFPIQESAAAVYRRIVEKRAEEYEIDFVRGVGGALTPLAYLDVMMRKAYENMVDEDTVIDPSDGLRAAEKLHAIIREKEEDPTDIADMMLKFNRLVDAVKQNVDPEVWPKIIAAVNDQTENIVDAEIEEEGSDDDAYDPGDPDMIDDDPGLDDGHL